MRKFLTVAVLGLAAFGLLAACAKRADYGTAAEYAPAGMTQSADMTGFAADRTASPEPGAPDGGTAANLANAQTGRKFVHTAQLELEVVDLDAAAQALEALIRSFGGYAESSNSSQSGAAFAIRVPVGRLDELLGSVGEIGKILSRSRNVQDVTESFYDLEGRLRTLRILEDRYRDYLRRATNIEEILQVERTLSETTGQIEGLEGSFRDLSGQIEQATVHVQLYPERTVELNRPSFLNALRRLLAGFGDVVRSVALILLGMIIYGVPLVLLLATLWWLLFGRVGLLRRLFVLVTRPGKAPK
ncbi:MAG: hypothetical protein A2087_02955 [Spirochaetes bacterium GWD1_61_31]|nr:MAG: hypothetical protein A2Y37_14050 [Spirochaetes bacterium GWB1_60_80]OHD34736.1 MAG: hypothetical protein A2004_00205 [Spirochaetes bacterium GWC1_61_12]OHD38728.1 MAG: hypothetical protein A2087_02955 [Spirochaetes bacterium GWD1_61_31]OHD44473.1 MAG: hypothetical protein A2Y35_04890 [Spirochaetes bacterium GWE1_60_18]OHD59377.1 MAG: hypothetical protein A2Y32_08605 [Spirochaetes bacterium GWF1_60_12]HAP43123.1 hypothetical protein [Spirochaetaceae bacterium]